jgi:hypothetical protein
MQRSQIRHNRRRNRSEVRDRIDQVHQFKNRNLKRLERGGETLKNESKRSKKEENDTKREALGLHVSTFSNSK